MTDEGRVCCTVPSREIRKFGNQGAELSIVTVMCQSCVEIDKQVERYRELLRSLTEQVEVERINQLIARLYADRVRLHRNPEQ
jgi:hypothetical protein